MSFNVAAKAASLALSGGNNDASTEVVVECNSAVFVSKSGVATAASKSVVVNPQLPQENPQLPQENPASSAQENPAS